MFQAGKFSAEVFEIVNRLASSAQFLDRLFGGFAGGVILGRASELLQHGNGPGIAQLAKRVDGSQGDSALGIVHVADEELTDVGPFFLVSCQVAKRAQT